MRSQRSQPSVEPKSAPIKPSDDSKSGLPRPSDEFKAALNKTSDRSALIKPSEESGAAQRGTIDKPKSALTKLDVAKEVLAKSKDDPKFAVKPGTDAKSISDPNLSEPEKVSGTADSQGLATKQELASLKLKDLLSETAEADEKRNRARDQHRISLEKMMRATTPSPTEEKKKTALAPKSETAAKESAAIQNTSQLPKLDFAKTEQRISRAEWRSQSFDAKPPSLWARFLSKYQRLLTLLAMPLFIIAFTVCIAHEMDLEKFHSSCFERIYREKLRPGSCNY